MSILPQSNNTHEESISRLNLILDTITSSTKFIIATIDKDYRFTYFNKEHQENIKRITGKDNRIGMTITELFSGLPEQQKSALELWSRVLNGEIVEQMVEFGPEHYQRFYQTRYVPIVDENGEVVGAGEVSNDITEARKTEEELRTSEERLRLTLQASEVGTFEIDLTTGACRWNAIEYELLGLKPGDARAAPDTFFNFVHPEDVAGLKAQ